MKIFPFSLLKKLLVFAVLIGLPIILTSYRTPEIETILNTEEFVLKHTKTTVITDLAY